MKHIIETITCDGCGKKLNSEFGVFLTIDVYHNASGIPHDRKFHFCFNEKCYINCKDFPDVDIRKTLD